MDNNEKTTEVIIFEAAKDVFTEKGFAAARMEEISKKAGINKALLHYYYRTKEKLFNAIFEKVMGDFFTETISKMYSDAPLFEKIEYFVDAYLTVITKNPHIPGFIINELNRNPERVVAIFKMTPIAKSNMFDKFSDMVKSEVEKGNIKPIAPEQLITNIIALSIFPVIAKPILQTILFKNDSAAYNKFIEGRKKEIAAFVINAIRVEGRSMNDG
jgi:AcrR family transcriptional regulator